MVTKTPAIKEKIAENDPEAAAIANYKLNYQYFLSRDDNQLIKILSANIQKFPENQYFLYEFAISTLCYLHDGGLDPAILLKLSNRLIELDGKNSNYYYMKAFALLRDRKGNNFDEAIETIKQANKCEYNEEPYSIYRDRVLSLAQKQRLHFRLIEELNYSHPDNFYTRDIYNVLIKYQNLLITERDFTKADEISNLLKSMLKDSMGESYLQHSIRTEQLYGFGGGFGYWTLPQEVELQRKNLTQTEADRKRLEMCATANPEKKVKAIYKHYGLNEKTEFYVIAVLPFMFFVRMTTVFILITAVLFIFSFFCKDIYNIKINKFSAIRFFIYGFVYFLAGQAPILVEFFGDDLCSCSHYSYADAFLFPPILFRFDYPDFEDIIYFLKEPYFLFPFVLPIGIVLGISIIKFFKPKFDNWVTRFICGIMISIPLGIITMFLQGHTYLKYLPIIIFILFAFKYSFNNVSFKNIFKTFAGTCENEIAALRANLVKQSVIAAILCWLGLLLLTYPVKKSMGEKAEEYKSYTYLTVSDYEKVYKDILKKIDDVNLPMQNIPRYIQLVKTADLPQVMQNLKNRKFLYLYNSAGLRSPFDKDYYTLTDMSICSMLKNAGKDQVPVIIKYMDNPDNSWALIARAQLGDKKVKYKLTAALNEAIKAENEPNEIEERYNPEKPRVSELISALAAISEPDETYALFKKHFETHTIEKIRFEYKNICTLSKNTILKIMNLYFDKAENEFDKTDNDAKHSSLYFLHDSGGLYLDNGTAERMLSLILRTSGNFIRPKDLGIEHYLTPDATDMLIKGLLQSDNENLRAWCVWQLRKINYKWNEAELRKIAEDKSWKVRANLAIIDKSLIKETETSDYVKLIKSM
ncbi:MAG: hypothetical protein NTW93_02150 [Phycisphaerae bacterium]|nr:hypothetical protein [Phycisphaerae bacterium]